MTLSAARFIPSAFARPVHGYICRDSDGTPYSEFTTGPGYDEWDGREYAESRTIDGVGYWYSLGYGSKTDDSIYFPVEAVRDELTQNGRTITLPSGMGCNYVPLEMPDSGTFVVEQWFYIWTAKPANGGHRDRPGYWRGEFTTGQTMDNPWWELDGKSRPVLLLREVWWDSYGGWVRGAPAVAGQLPWVGAAPARIAVVPSEHNYYGYDAGPLWRGTDAGVPVHLRTCTYGEPYPPPDPPKVEPTPPIGVTPMPVTIVLSDSAANELRSQLCSSSSGPPGPTVPPPTGGGGGGGTPPPVVSGTVNYELQWQNTTGANRLKCPFTCDEMLCIHFRTPAGALPNAGVIGMAEYGSAPCNRFAVISKTPGDFNGGLGVPPFNAATGLSLSWNIVVGGPAQAYTTVLEPGTDYYINVRNTDRYGTKSCSTGASTTMFCDLRLPT